MAHLLEGYEISVEAAEQFSIDGNQGRVPDPVNVANRWLIPKGFGRSPEWAKNLAVEKLSGERL